MAISGGLIWWLPNRVEIDSRAPNNRIKQGEVKGAEAIERVNQRLKDEVINGRKVTLEKVNKEIERRLPAVVKKEIEKINERFSEKGDEVVKSTEEVIKETKLAEEIEKIIKQTTKEIEGFPEKQKEEIKKEAVKQVCDTLMEEIENDKSKK